MSRTTKNVIYSLILFLLIASLVFTAYAAIKSPIINTINGYENAFYTFKTGYFLLLSLEGYIIGCILSYLILSKFNSVSFKDTLHSFGKYTIVFMCGFLSLSIINMFLNPFAVSLINENKNRNAFSNYSFIEIKNYDINLSSFEDNIMISKGGIYNLTGAFSNSIFIDTDEDVTLNLDNVTINTYVVSPIINFKSNLIINSLEDSNNIVSSNVNDSSSVIYKSSIYTNNNLIIGGEGNINISYNSNSDSSIKSVKGSVTFLSGNVSILSNNTSIEQLDNNGSINIDGGNIYINAFNNSFISPNSLNINGGTTYIVNSSKKENLIKTFNANGGTLLSIGKDLNIESDDYNKGFIQLVISEPIEKGNILTLTDLNNNPIITFKAKEVIDTLFITNSDITNGRYYLYKNCHSNGTLINGIYYNGKTTLGDRVIINGLDYIDIN